MTYRSSDRQLDEHLIARAVFAQFPELGGSAVRRLGAGWDHELFVIGNDEWVFRFPKRAERVPWLLRELEVVERVAPALDDVVARFEYKGLPSDVFPYPFVGYRFVRGVEADESALPRHELAGELGALLAALHRVDPTGLPATPATWEGEDPARAWTSELATLAELVEARLPRRLRARAAPYLSGAVPSPATPGPAALRLCHNDICAEHLLVDASTGGLAGVLDWTDAMVTDPVVDFVGLITVGGLDFVAEVVASYVRRGGDGVDAGFWERLAWRSRVVTLVWLGEALGTGPRGFGRQVEWVTRAFAEPAGSPPGGS